MRKEPLAIILLFLFVVLSSGCVQLGGQEIKPEYTPRSIYAKADDLGDRFLIVIMVIDTRGARIMADGNATIEIISWGNREVVYSETFDVHKNDFKYKDQLLSITREIPKTSLKKAQQPAGDLFVAFTSKNGTTFTYKNIAGGIPAYAREELEQIRNAEFIKNSALYNLEKTYGNGQMKVVLSRIGYYDKTAETTCQPGSPVPNIRITGSVSNIGPDSYEEVSGGPVFTIDGKQYSLLGGRDYNKVFNGATAPFDFMTDPCDQHPQNLKDKKIAFVLGYEVVYEEDETGMYLFPKQGEKIIFEVKGK